MKTTFFAILASAAVVLASPLPEAEAGNQGMPPAYGSQGGNPPSHDHGQWGGRPVGGAVGGFAGEFSGTFQWLSQGVAPPTQFGYQNWPAPGGFPEGSPFNADGISSFGSTCSNTQQAVSCCSGGDSSGLLGGLLPSACTLDILSPHCQQNVACCDTQTQSGLINIGLQCSSLL